MTTVAAALATGQGTVMIDFGYQTDSREAPLRDSVQ
jgi:hypothetical protein